MGAMAPLNFQKYQKAPVSFEDGQGKNDRKFIYQSCISRALAANIFEIA